MNTEQEYSRPEGSGAGLPPPVWAGIAFGGTLIGLTGLTVLQSIGSGQGVVGSLTLLFNPGELVFWPMLLLPLASGAVGWWQGRKQAEQRRQSIQLTLQMERQRDELSAVWQQLEEAQEEIAHAKEKFLRTTARMRVRLSRMLSPGQGPKRVDLLEIIDSDILQDIQDAFAVAFGIGSEVRDPEAESLTRPSNTPDVCNVVRSSALGRQECFWFMRGIVEKAAKHKRPIFKKCKSCGLVCGGAPMIVDDRHVATWLAGQVRTEETDEAELVAKAEDLGITPAVLLGAYRVAPRMNQAAYEAALELLWFITREIASMGYNNLRLARDSVMRLRAEREARLAWGALDQVGEGIVLADPTGKIVVANEAFCTQLGCTRAELLDRKLRDLRPESCGPGEDFLAEADSAPVRLRQPDGEAEVELKVVRSEITAGDTTFTCLMTRPVGDRMPVELDDPAEY